MRKTINTLMPWCEACQCYHDDAAKHVADVQKQIAERMRQAELLALHTLIGKYPTEAKAILEGLTF